jgi:hypothetical protein
MAAPAPGVGPYINAALIPGPTDQVFATDRLQPTSERPSPSSEMGAFRIACKYSHMSYDDPIVYPGQPGRAHLHTFFGNTAANANSTYDSLLGSGNSTCTGGTINRSAYWVPSMIDTRTGKPIVPSDALWYYKGGIKQALGADRSINDIPAGLKMIAGDARAAGAVERPIYHFSCYTPGLASQSATQYTIPSCPAGHFVHVNILFPQCWDGRNLDSPDHKSHMAYPWGKGWTCPTSHPVGIPEISLNIYWQVPDTDVSSAAWRLSSDVYDASQPAGYSMHADWFDGWKPDIKRAWVDGCVRAVADCHAHLIGDGRSMY